MRAYWTLTQRELGTFFLSWTGYVVMTVVLLLLGIGCSFILGEMQSTARPLTELFTPFFWLVVIPIAPVLTMRLFSRERATGTFETLMTTPVSDLEVVLAKFSAAYVFFLLLWTPLGLGIYILRSQLNDPLALDLGLVLSTYTGMALVGAVFLSVGTLTSALSRNQVNAAILSFGFGLLLFFLGLVALYPPIDSPRVIDVLNHVSLVLHMQDFSRGVIDSRHAIFSLSLSGLFLYLTLKVVESRRWK